MNYYLSEPLLEKYVPTASLKDIITLHGTYDDFNNKLRQSCNLPEQIAAFERCLCQDELEWLSQFNVTLYSGKAQQELLTGVEVQFQPSEVGAVATMLHDIPFISVDVDMLVENPNNWTPVQLHGYISQVLVHECTHLMQMKRGDLTVTNTAMVWKGNEFSHDYLATEVAALRSAFPDPDEFQFQLVNQQVQFPWELEAYGRTLEMVDIDVAYPDERWNSLMRKIQQDFRAIYKDNSKDENVH